MCWEVVGCGQATGPPGGGGGGGGCCCWWANFIGGKVLVPKKKKPSFGLCVDRGNKIHFGSKLA
jgi:hypothetical protein